MTDETFLDIRELTTDEVIRGVREIVNERPDYQYRTRQTAVSDANLAADTDDPDTVPTCFYVHNEADGTKVPGCIVGHWLNRQGVPLADLEQVEGNSAQYVTEGFLPHVTYEALGFLAEIQQKQDQGETWGNAYRTALDIEGLADPDE